MSDSGHHRIEFEPGEVVKPEFDPENNLTGLLVTDEGLERLRADLGGADNAPTAEGESIPSSVDAEAPPNVPDGHPAMQGEPFDSGTIDLGFGVITYEVRLPPDLKGESNERP